MAKNKPNTPSSTLPGANAGGPGAGGADAAGCVPNPDSPAGAAAEGCPAEEHCCTITSQTVQTQPANRARTRIGVGEVVNLTVDPAPGTWSVSGGGTISPTSGATVQFTAGDVAAASVTVTAQAGGCSCTLDLEVVAPTGVSIRRDDARGFFHRSGKPSAGFVGIVHIMPDDVNFDAIEYKEDDVEAVGTDRLTFMTGQGHHPTTGWLPVSERVIAGRGSESGIDQVQVEMNITGSLDPGGRVTWSIPWRYRVRGGSSHRFPTTIEQLVVMDTAGEVTISKGGASVAKARNASSSSMDTTPPEVEEEE